MCCSMLYGAIAIAILIAGFAYIVLSSANKEAGNMKLAGQIIAVLIALVAVAVLIHGSTAKTCPMMGGSMMMENKMEMMKKNPAMMQKAGKGSTKTIKGTKTVR